MLSFSEDASLLKNRSGRLNEDESHWSRRCSIRKPVVSVGAFDPSVSARPGCAVSTPLLGSEMIPTGRHQSAVDLRRRLDTLQSGFSITDSD